MTLFDTGPDAPRKQTTAEKAAAKLSREVAEGFHPLATQTLRLTFHPRAAPRYAAGDGLRCDSCRLVTATKAGPRCQLRPLKKDPDVNPTWPACVKYQPKETPYL